MSAYFVNYSNKLEIWYYYSISDFISLFKSPFELSGTFRQGRYNELKKTFLQEEYMPVTQNNTSGTEWSELSRRALEPLLQSRDRILGTDDAMSIKLRKMHQLLLYAIAMVAGGVDTSCEDIIRSGRITQLAGIVFPLLWSNRIRQRQTCMSFPWRQREQALALSIYGQALEAIIHLHSDAMPTHSLGFLTTNGGSMLDDGLEHALEVMDRRGDVFQPLAVCGYSDFIVWRPPFPWAHYFPALLQAGARLIPYHVDDGSCIAVHIVSDRDDESFVSGLLSIDHFHPIVREI